MITVTLLPDGTQTRDVSYRHAAIALCCLLSLMLANVPAISTAAGAAALPGVIVHSAKMAPVVGRRSYTGRVEAISRVEIRARVTGYLGPLQFTEGDEVKKGALLYQIETAPYAATVAEAKANVASAEAGLALARVNHQRASRLSKDSVVSKSDLDTARAELQQSEALVLANKAALQRAELDLGYTEIRAPVDGRIGVSNFSTGDLVGSDSGTLALLVSQDPMRVSFPVPQRRLLEVQRSGLTPDQVLVRLQLTDGSSYAETGRILYADVQANPTTDTITVRASFPNPARQLVDRQLVDVFVEDKAPEQRLVIPQAALALDQQGAYVLVVNADDVVERRRIRSGEQRQGMLSVLDGLRAGERVIVSGQLKVSPGMKVSPSEDATTEGGTSS